MAQVIVRNLDDRVVEDLKSRAKLRGHSLEQELRDILTRVAMPDRAERLSRIDRIRELTPPGLNVDVEALIRADRECR